MSKLPAEDALVTTPAGYKYEGEDSDPETPVIAVQVSPTAAKLDLSRVDALDGVARMEVQLDRRGAIRKVDFKGAALSGDTSAVLVEPALASARLVNAAIAALKEQGMEGESIVVICIVAAPEAVDEICAKHPDVQIITAALDVGVDRNGDIVPGAGSFDSRYVPSASRASSKQ